jgi:hypothetical protein
VGGYAERAALLEEGRKSHYFLRLMDFPGKALDEEQYGLMALICDKFNEPPTDTFLASFVNTVQVAQSLMPGGTLRSRQILVLLALQAQTA